MADSSKGKVTKWIGLAAGIWVQALAGNGCVFPHFAPALKQQLLFSQVQLNNLGVAKDVGESVGLMAGLLSNVVSPWILLLIGAFEGFFGFGLLWLVMAGHIAPLPYWQLCILLLIGANSTTCFNTAVLVTTLRNFPESRGMVVGIVKGFIGLSCTIFTQIFVVMLQKNATDLMLLLAVGPSSVCLLVMYFIRPVKTAPRFGIFGVDPDEQRGFAFVHTVCFGLAGYLLTATVFEIIFPEVSPVIYQIVIAFMLVFLFSPLLVPAKFAYDKWLIRETLRKRRRSPAQAPQRTGENGLRQPLLQEEPKLKSESSFEDSEQQSGVSVYNPDQNSDENKSPSNSSKSEADTAAQEPQNLSNRNDENAPSNARGPDLPESGQEDTAVLLAVAEGAVPRRRKGPRRGEDFTLMEALVKADFWLLFFTFFCGMGTGITAINNLGQIGQAQGYTDVTMFVSLIGVMNFLGRLGAGSISERFVRSSALPRTVWILAAQLLMIVGHLLFATALPGSLYAGSVILGICYGVHVAIMVPTASELFGLRHFGMIYNFMTMGNPVGSLLFSGIIAGYIYDKELAKSPSVTGVHQRHIFDRYLTSSVNPLFDSAACVGAHCFRLTFFIMAAVCVLGIALNLLLTYRIRRVYRSLYASRNPSFGDLVSAGADKSTTSS